MAIKRTRESEEMYLETILLLHREHANVRAVDVGEELGYAKSSVSRGATCSKTRDISRSTLQRGTSPSRKRAKKRQRASMNATA